MGAGSGRHAAASFRVTWVPHDPFDHPPVPLPRQEGGGKGEYGGHPRAPGRGASPSALPGIAHENRIRGEAPRQAGGDEADDGGHPRAPGRGARPLRQAQDRLSALPLWGGAWHTASDRRDLRRERCRAAAGSYFESLSTSGFVGERRSFWCPSVDKLRTCFDGAHGRLSALRAGSAPRGRQLARCTASVLRVQGAAVARARLSRRRSA